MAFDSLIYQDMRMTLGPARKYAEVQFMEAFRNLMEDHGGRMLKADPLGYKPQYRVALALFKDDKGKDNMVAGVYLPAEREGFVVSDIDAAEWPFDLTSFCLRVRKDPANT